MKVVAIDGPSGSGKSTVARAVAEELGLAVLDTGAMYRSVTLAALERGVALDEEGACAQVARDVTIEVGSTVVLDGRDVTAAIRGPEVTAAVSQVAAHPRVRRELVARQRAWVDDHAGGVVEGRDIGTVVFPDATVKVYLTAADDERARRRANEQAEAEADVGAVQESLARRDEHDTRRSTSPLRVAPDALVIDSTDRAVGDIVREIVARFRTAGATEPA